MLEGSMKDIPVEEISLAGPASRRSTELKGIKFMDSKGCHHRESRMCS